MKTISIELLSEKLNGKLWIKDNLTRIYLYRGYNTKKMTTKTYISQRKDGSFCVSCTISCPSQPKDWILSQEQEIIKSLMQEIADVINEHGYENENKENSSEEDQVQGYYMRWHEVKVPINSYGKLATRKRQKVHTYKGCISETPAGFMELSDNQFAKAIDFEKKGMLFEFGETPTF